ncbi:hypothetical protein OSB04_010336 [Centaurea solstitialis]|uniref:NLP1-9 GAF domain-containing protein n=1 Tax=Centaurea solstitialis TaxID=347529 RepID=A0AA38WCR1_9ASTR|nr:hypothetical protein OSB04_010336 [Centaurea solstitialis]
MVITNSKFPTDIAEPIQDKIRYAFQNLGMNVLFTVLIQFWAPVSVCGRRLLATSGQPFALFRREGASDRRDQEHRLCSLKYKYDIDHVNNKVEVFEEDPTILTDGPPASAFRNRIPELVVNNSVHPKNPLESSASRCGGCFCVVPVFDPSQSGECVGVVECFTFFTADLIHAFSKLNIALEDQGLKAFDAHDHLPYKPTCGLQNAKDELDKALKIISKAHGLPLSQVWIPNQDAWTKQILWLKLTGHIGRAFLDDADLEGLEDYDSAYYRLPMKMDDMFAGKTLENYEPLFIEKSEYDHQHHLFSNCDYLLLICLRSTKTGDLDYVFEFLWNEKQGVILLEPLLLTLERYLPSFKFASGKELGDEIDILDVDNSKGNENKYIKIFQQNKLSPKRWSQSKVEECFKPSKARGKTTLIELSREDIKSQFGQTMEEVAPKLDASVSTLKRKCKDEQGEDRSKRNVKHSCNNQSYTNEEEDQGGASQDPSLDIIRETLLDENILTIKAENADDN